METSAKSGFIYKGERENSSYVDNHKNQLTIGKDVRERWACKIIMDARAFESFNKGVLSSYFVPGTL